MHKRFRKSTELAAIGDSSSSDQEASAKLQRRRSFVRMRRKKRGNDLNDLNISDTSSDEEQVEEEQENRKWLQNLKRYSSSQKPLLLTPPNKFQPLSLSVSGKSSSGAPTLEDAAHSSKSAGWQSSRTTLATLKHNRRGVLQTSNSNCSYQTDSQDSLLDCSRLIEANLETMIDTQQTPKSAKRISSVQKKKRCLKGGYLHEYKQLMLKERMDRRSLAHNQRLGITSGQRVHVLGTCASFGTPMARVQTESEPKTIFNIIVAPSMASHISEGSTLELYFDLKWETSLQLPNKELVYVEPNKIVLL